MEANNQQTILPLIEYTDFLIMEIIFILKMNWVIILLHFFMQWWKVLILSLWKRDGTYRPWSFKPVIDITGWYFFPVIFFLLFPDKFIYSALINWPIGNTLMKPITDCKQQEQDYRQKMSACNVSYRHKRSGP